RSPTSSWRSGRTLRGPGIRTGLGTSRGRSIPPKPACRPIFRRISPAWPRLPMRNTAPTITVTFGTPSKKGMGKHRRGSNSESGMRLLRRLEKNHDGIRSAATRQHYIQIYQAIKYLSLDVTAFLEKGPQLAELPDV